MSTSAHNGLGSSIGTKDEAFSNVIEEKKDDAQANEDALKSKSSNTTQFKIYTKTGDKGDSSLYSGERRQKDDDVFHALGDVDELNSGLGLAHEFCRQDELEEIVLQIEEIQSRLLDVGSAVATPLGTSAARKLAQVKFDPMAVIKLEQWIDKMDEELPPLKNFILPSGGLMSSQLHVARALCRRAERKVVPLVKAGHVDAEVGIFLNRLSDYLFTAARLAAKRGGHQEVVYKKL